MPIEFACPHCGGALTSPDEAAGHAGRCRFCNAVIRAPRYVGGAAELIQPGADVPPPGSEDAGRDAPGWHMDYPAAPIGEVSPGLIFGEAWRVTAANWGTLAAGMVVTGGSIALGAMMLTLGFGAGPAAYTSVLVTLTLFALIVTPLYFGFYAMAIECVTRGQTGLGTLLAPYGRIGPLVVTSMVLLLVSAPLWSLMFYLSASLQGLLPAEFRVDAQVVGAWSALAAVSLYVTLGWMWAPLEVVDRGTPAGEALSASWAAARGRRLVLLFTGFLFWIVSVIGSWLILLSLFTVPLGTVGMVITFRQLRGLQGRIR